MESEDSYTVTFPILILGVGSCAHTEMLKINNVIIEQIMCFFIMRCF